MTPIPFIHNYGPSASIHSSKLFLPNITYILGDSTSTFDIIFTSSRDIRFKSDSDDQKDK